MSQQSELSIDELSCSVRETEEAPSNHGNLAIEQQGVVMVTISDVEGEDEEELAAACENSQRHSQEDAN